MMIIDHMKFGAPGKCPSPDGEVPRLTHSGAPPAVAYSASTFNQTTWNALDSSPSSVAKRRIPIGAQERPNRFLMASGSHPEAVSGLGAFARCSTTTRRSISPFKKAFRKAG
jgi:hypothetical protein